MPQPPVAEGISKLGQEDPTLAHERRQLERGGRLHIVHWLVVLASLALTLGVWYYSYGQLQKQKQARFEQQFGQVQQLVRERLEKYEEALWAGVAAYDANDGEMSLSQWRRFSAKLRIEQRYPGINGLGFIAQMAPAELSDYAHKMQQQRPDFKVYPRHQQNIALPIQYIEPVADNRQAVGLDVAHETNRLTAALMARDTGNAAITGPIVLVQDAEKTPGFLFYTPVYKDPSAQYSSTAERRQQFVGLVYAPFVVKKLMQGTLSQAQRQIGLRISDSGEVMYDELNDSYPDYDPEPLFSRRAALDVYGRPWQFEIQTGLAFREATDSKQPALILAGGIFLDSLLLLLFILLTRANRRALSFAGRMSDQANTNARALAKSVDKLRASNHDLEQFAYAASHDLQEPLRTMSVHVQLIARRLEGHENDIVAESMGYVRAAANRMSGLVSGLLSYSRIGQNTDRDHIDCNELVNELLQDLDEVIRDTDAVVECSNLPTVVGHPHEIRQLFQNLISNALKFGDASRPLLVSIRSWDESGFHHFEVADTGIGIEERYFDHIFTIFKRLHGPEAYPGNGIGLAQCKKIVSSHDGKISLRSEVDKGSSFDFSIKKY